MKSVNVPKNVPHVFRYNHSDSLLTVAAIAQGGTYKTY